MTKETITLLIRHGMTALGIMLTQADIATTDEMQAFTDAITSIAGTAMTAAGLAWSFQRKWKRKKQEAKQAQPVSDKQ